MSDQSKAIGAKAIRDRREFRQARKHTQRLAGPNTEELTAAGGGPMKDIAHSYVAQLAQNPDDLILASKGGGLKIYEKVLQDDQVFSTFQQRRLALLSKEVDVQPGATDKQSIAAADALRENIACIEFDKICNKMAFGIFYGYGVGECMWGRDGRHWAMDTVKVRKARRFKFDNDRQLRLASSTNPNGILMEERKFWTFESGADNDDNPYGVGLGSWCYWPAYFKRHGLQFWMLAMEKFGAPTAVGKYPANATKAEKQKLLDAVIAFTSVSGVTIPEGMDIALLTAGARIGMNHGTLYTVMDKSISKTVLSQTMTTDDGSSNSQAQVHENVADNITAADADLQCSSFMAGPGKWMTEWNYPGAALPILRRKTEAPEDLNQQADRDTKLYNMGWEPTGEHILRVYGDGYQKRTDIAKEPANNKALPGLGAREDSPEFEQFVPLTPADNAVDHFLQSEDHARDLETETDALITKIEQALENAETLEDAARGLAGLLGVDKDDAFATRLARANFNARLAGRRAPDPKEI